MADSLCSPCNEKSGIRSALQRSARVEAELKRYQHDMKNQCNVLFMGRDTQDIMRALRSDIVGFSYEDRLRWRVPIFCCIEAQVRKLPDMLQNRSLDDLALSLNSLDIFGPQKSHKCTATWTPRQLDLLRSDTLHSMIQLVKEDFDDGAYFFLSHIKRVTNPGYIPSNEDILRVPYGFWPAGSGLDVFCLPKRPISVNIINIDRMRGGRKKFIHMFDKTQVIVADADLSTFDEDYKGAAPTLKDDMAWFESIARIRWFNTSSFVLLLRRYRAFSSRLAHKSFTEVYPDFSGSNDPTEAVTYICQKIQQSTKSAAEIFPYVCQDDVPKSSHIGDFFFDIATHSLARSVTSWGDEKPMQRVIRPPVFEELT